MLEGDISQINLIERLVELWREQFTGAIRFENDGIIKIVYFKGGDILSASTNDRSDSIDEILMRAGKVSREHVKQALAKRKENETLGDALLNLGFITRKELTWARRVQVVGVIRSIAAWQSGSFTIVADYLPKRDEGTLFPLPQVLVELIVTEQDRGRFERALDGGNAVFTKAGDFDTVFRRLGLNDDAEAIAAEIDGEKSATEIATASGRDTFNVYKLLDAMATLGIVTRVAKAQPQFALDDFAAAGVADAADVWNEPTAVVQSAPDFELDADTPIDFAPEPTIELPVTSFDETEIYPKRTVDAAPTIPGTAGTSVWDDAEDELPLDVAPIASADEEETVFTTPEPPPSPSRMPAWDTPPREPMAVPIPAAIEPPADTDEEPKWGFDEAQIETARRASVPVESIAPPPPVAASVAAKGSRPPKQGGRRSGLLITLLVLAILAGAGYYGFQWWQGTQETQPEVLASAQRPVERRPLRPAAAAATTTAPIVETTATVTPTTTSLAPTATVTETVAPIATPPPAPAPRTITPAPAAAPAAGAALPVVTPKGGRERYDALARQYAANPTGNFTVQIQILCDPANVEKAMRAGGENVWFVPQTISGRSCYRVFWGRYNSRDEAQTALAQVPATIRDESSAVKAVPK
jgi:hypothetical protein